MEEKMLTVSEAATVLGMKPGSVRDAVARGRLVAVPVGGGGARAGLLLFLPTEVARYQGERKPPGRPPRQERGEKSGAVFEDIVSPEVSKPVVADDTFIPIEPLAHPMSVDEASVAPVTPALIPSGRGRPRLPPPDPPTMPWDEWETHPPQWTTALHAAGYFGITLFELRGVLLHADLADYSGRPSQGSFERGETTEAGVARGVALWKFAAVDAALRVAGYVPLPGQTIPASPPDYIHAPPDRREEGLHSLPQIAEAHDLTQPTLLQRLKQAARGVQAQRIGGFIYIHEEDIPALVERRKPPDSSPVSIFRTPSGRFYRKIAGGRKRTVAIRTIRAWEASGREIIYTDVDEEHR